VLLLDEPAAGVPRTRAQIFFAAISGPFAGTSPVLFIEHDMDVVFPLREPHHRHGGGRILAQGTPQEIGANPRVARGLPGQRPPWLSRSSRTAASRAGYGDAVVLGRRLARGAGARSLAVLAATASARPRFSSPFSGSPESHKGNIFFRGPDVTRTPRISARGRPRLVAQSAKSPVADGGET